VSYFNDIDARRQLIVFFFFSSCSCNGFPANLVTSSSPQIGLLDGHYHPCQNRQVGNPRWKPDYVRATRGTGRMMLEFSLTTSVSGGLDNLDIWRHGRAGLAGGGGGSGPKPFWTISKSGDL
jgi:hypothetical protein